jgi:hypothetical protein
MSTDLVSSRGPKALRRTAIWPWLVMPLVILALFVVLHDVRPTAGAEEQDSTFGSGSP